VHLFRPEGSGVNPVPPVQTAFNLLIVEGSTTRIEQESVNGLDCSDSWQKATLNLYVENTLYIYE
jgi:hypothetical protein